MATCEYNEVLENAIRDTEQKITTLEQKIDNDTSALQQQVLQLTNEVGLLNGRICLLYTSPSPRDSLRSRMPSSA